jgi:hypothetical protein
VLANQWRQGFAKAGTRITISAGLDSPPCILLWRGSYHGEKAQQRRRHKKNTPVDLLKRRACEWRAQAKMLDKSPTELDGLIQLGPSPRLFSVYAHMKSAHIVHLLDIRTLSREPARG